MSFLRWLRHWQILTQLFAHIVRKNQVRIRAKAVGELAHQRRGEEFSPQASTLVPSIAPHTEGVAD